MKQQQAVIQCKEKVVVVTAPNGERISVDVVIQAQPIAIVNQFDDSINKEDPVVDECNTPKFATFENRVKMIYLWIFVCMKT